MKNYYIISNPDKDPGGACGSLVCSYLKERGAAAVISSPGELSEGPYRYTDPRKVPEGCECIVVVGGDGTLLQAARDVRELSIPLVGINLGNLGFLAEVDLNGLYPALDQLLEDSCGIEERMMLSGSIWREGVKIAEDTALNDIVIAREGPVRVLPIDNFVNGEYLNSYDADGIILSTPTGSTGYSLSVGGPIVSPRASLIIMTPIAPHTLNSRSLIFPAEDEICVEIGTRKRSRPEQAMVTFDGGSALMVSTGDRIRIRRAPQTVRIVRVRQLSFVELLRQKMKNT